jgi:hypothetical protein
MGNVLQNIVVVVGFGLLAVLGWYLYAENDRLKLNTSTSDQLEREVQAFIQKQNTLQNINLDTSILQNGDFRSLEAVTQPVPSQPRGRTNPFVPADELDEDDTAE